MLTETMVEIARKCYRECKGVCPGDLGEVKCFFCAGCVLGVEERAGNLEIWTSEMTMCHG